MILGMGVDIIEIERIEKVIDKWGDNFLRHVFHPEEIAYAQRFKNPAQHYAARFAAKEAVFKAFATRPKITWKDIKITNNKHGQPVCTFNDKKFKGRIIISLSHSDHYAVASAVITQE
jgi:holo-[acyl-carrier protein] synthase